ncbi:MAG: hypothetical protein KDC34_17105 [Saprospiraceae bacterium]|nr:hypothetical protein [Saprospiraceae bacterium]
MKRILISALISGLVLFAFSYLILFVSIKFFPTMLEEYYNPVFWPGSERALLFYFHPFVLSLALAWFWNRVKSIFKGNTVLKGLEFGLVYGLIATLPAMWICFSALNVTLGIVITWLVYGVTQAIIAGLIFARMNP